MAEGLKYGRAVYKGVGNIGERDESLAGRAAAVAPSDGWTVDPINSVSFQQFGAYAPNSPTLTHFIPLPIYERDFVLTEARMRIAVGGAVAYRSALYVLNGKEISRLPGSLVDYSTLSTGLKQQTLAIPVTLQAGKRYFMAVGNDGVGTFGQAYQMLLSTFGCVQTPYIASNDFPSRVNIFDLQKRIPTILPYALYLSSEAALVL